MFKPTNNDAYYMLAGWLGLWVLSVFIQYKQMYSKKKDEDDDEPTTKNRKSRQNARNRGMDDQWDDEVR